jgi:hypothetical protein
MENGPNFGGGIRTSSVVSPFSRGEQTDVLSASRWKEVSPALVVAAALAASYQQASLYISNQYAAFVPGFARAGYGNLAADWIAQKGDPIPVVTWLVETTMRAHWVSGFYVYFALLAAVYAYAILGLGAYAGSLKRSAGSWWLFAAIVVALHAHVLSRIAAIAFGPDRTTGAFERGLTWGVANQHVLGPFFEPATFGVLLVLAILLFVRDRLYTALLVCALTSVIHPTYLLSSTSFVVAFAVATYYCDRDLAKASRIVVLGAAALFPVALFVLLRFGPTSADAWRQSQQILVDVRIPHHAKPEVWSGFGQSDKWFGAGTVLRIGLIATAIYVTRTSILFWVLLTPAVIAIVLTIVQLTTGSTALALLFPWRISAVLVPVSTAVVLGKGIGRLVASRPLSPHRERAIFIGSAVAITCLTVIGLRDLSRQMQRDPLDRRLLMETFVATHSRPTDLYVVPIELDGFRLHTGTPILVDWKFAPVHDVDVIEWYARIKKTRSFYASTGMARCSEMNVIVRSYGVNHVVLPRQSGALSCAGTRLLYADTAFAVYGLDPAG